MIKKLQKKFVLVNMMLISIVLLIVFGVLIFSNYTSQNGILNDALQMELSRSDEDPSLHKVQIGGPDQRPNDNMALFPLSFCVLLDEDQSILSVRGQNVSISDEVLAALVTEVMTSGKSSGSIPSLYLRYAVSEADLNTASDTQAATTASPHTRIAFIETSNMLSSMRTLVLYCLLVFVLALLAFLIISIFLSRWVILPVKQAWEQQRQFIADASHELKTPLTVILANTNILLNHSEDTIETQQKWVLYISEEAKRMKLLVEDMLFLAKSDASKRPKLQSEVNLSDLVWNCLLPFESVAFEQGLTLHSEITSDVVLKGDATQLKQLVGILLDNACKYADSGGHITLQLLKVQEHPVLSVTNTGSFIPEEARKHLFERFYRVDAARDRKDGGYGLGLAIAQSIITSHQGKISVKSSEKNGTTFEIIF